MYQKFIDKFTNQNLNEYQLNIAKQYIRTLQEMEVLIVKSILKNIIYFHKKERESRNYLGLP